MSKIWISGMRMLCALSSGASRGITLNSPSYSLTQTRFPISHYSSNSTRSDQLATKQCFGSVFDPDLIRSVNPFPDSDSESGSGSRRANKTHKRRKKFKHLIFRNAGWFFWRSEGFFSNLDVLYRGLGIGTL
jgi:hypothetical protein